MKLIKVKVPDEYIQNLEKLIGMNSHHEERREDFRLLIRERIRNEIRNLENINSHVKIDKKNYKPYELCIFCDLILHNPKKPYNFKKYNIIELRPCCHCIKKYEGKSFEELPANIREKILKKAEKIYKSI